MSVRYLILLGLLIYAVYTDMTWTKISNRLISLGLLLGLILRIIGEGSVGILVFLFNISIPVILLYLFFQMHALGAGDIKLFSVAGAFLSTEQLIWLMIGSFCVGAGIGLVKLIYNDVILRKVRGRLTQIHFSPAILIAYLMVTVWL